MDIKKYLKNPYVMAGAGAGILVLVIYTANRRKVEYVQVPVYSSEPKTESSTISSPSPVVVSEDNMTDFLRQYMEYMSEVQAEQHRENLVMQAQILEAIREQRESISNMPAAISESIVPVVTKQVSAIEPYFEPYQVVTKRWTEEGYKPVTVTIDDPFEQLIMAAKQAYYEAEQRKDTEAMKKAHEIAEQAREEARKKGVVLGEWAKSGE